jgi:hypothetical protein
MGQEMSISNLYPNLSPSLSLDFARTKALDSRITFSRASEGRFFDGKTYAKAEENLLLQSQDFGSASWAVADGATKGSAVTAPDGTSTATSVNLISTGTSRIQQSVAVTSGAEYTFSVWLRVASGTLAIRIGNINLAVYQSVTATTTWQRFSVTQNASSATRFPSIAADGVDGTVEIWGAQLEQRSSVTAYTPTTTQPITNYIPVLQTAAANVARFDHNPLTSESLGLLIEESRTNLLLRSEQFETTWALTRATLSTNQLFAPDGTLTADKLIENTDNNSHQVSQVVTTVAATTYAFSVYLKAGERSWAVLNFFDGTTNYRTWFNLSAGTVGSNPGANTASISSAGNGWYRCTIVRAAIAASSTPVVLTSTGDNVLTYTGDGYSGIYIWGAQLEVGAFPTSYIPTSASQVTRNADAASMTGVNFSSWYRQDQGTLYADFLRPVPATTTTMIAHIESDSSNRHALFFTTTGSGAIRGFTATTAGSQADVSTLQAISTSVPSRAAYAYKVNDFAASANGSSVATDTSGTLPEVNALWIGQRASGNALGGCIRKISYYPQRISNTALQALTS